MKQILFVFSLVCFLTAPLFSVTAVSTTTTTSTAKISKEEANKEWQSLSKKEQRIQKKEARKKLKKSLKDLRKGETDDTLILLAILSVLLPPLAMYLHEGDVTNRFWLSLVLTILGFLPGVVYTLIVILGEN
ncbi:MAG: YqaE/Pmp3 family membrane protein [Bacteroidetes bacterium]|jgi:uncharacterized membrane protein YqaE (UPF0057 family)|nr:YqaE/Pmp3 family membrane protein [Bacteroidota bacterium]MDF1865691.1 YqaE/Pmp3 family membrane protein [Saprospiraceae bacterium]